MASNSNLNNNDNMNQQAKVKWARLLLRELYDLGYYEAANTLEKEACITLQSPTMTKFQAYIKAEQWDDALQLLPCPKSFQNIPLNTTQLSIDNEEKVNEFMGMNKIQMLSIEAVKEASLLLRIRKYMMLISMNQLNDALLFAQSNILSVYDLNEKDMRDMAGLLLINSTDARDFETKVPKHWQCDHVLAKIESLVSPNEIVPHGALRKTLLTPTALKGDSLLGLDMEHTNCMWSLRSLEDDFRITGDCPEILYYHSDQIWELQISPNGQYLASGAKDGTVLIWELNFISFNGIPHSKLHLEIHPIGGAPVHSLAWRSDSRYLLTCNGRGNIQLWDIQTGDSIHAYPSSDMSLLAWLPDNIHFVSGNKDKSLLLWDAFQNKFVYEWINYYTQDIAMSFSESKLFALVNSLEIQMIDMESYENTFLYQSTTPISCITLSADGHQLLINELKTQKIICLDITTAKVLYEYQDFYEKRYKLRPTFIRAGINIIACGDEHGNINIWHNKVSKSKTILKGHYGAVNTIVNHPIFANILISCGDDGTIRFWRLHANV